MIHNFLTPLEIPFQKSFRNAFRYSFRKSFTDCLTNFQIFFTKSSGDVIEHSSCDSFKTSSKTSFPNLSSRQSIVTRLFVEKSKCVYKQLGVAKRRLENYHLKISSYIFPRIFRIFPMVCFQNDCKNSFLNIFLEIFHEILQTSMDISRNSFKDS